MLEYLTQAQIDKFHRDGYLVIPKFLSTEESGALFDRAKQLLDEFNIDDHPRTKFTTGDKQVGDHYFLTSGDKIRYFFEEDAVDSQGRLVREKQKAVNKIGHALHELDPVFRRVTLENERIRTLVRDLKFHRDPVALQSMLIFKQPQIGGEVVEHTDSYAIFPGYTNSLTYINCKYAHCRRTFLYTNPPSALGFWIALEKCTAANGALSFLPGSHLYTPITKRFVRIGEGKGTGFEHIVPSGVQKEAESGKEGEYILETCNPGDLVLIHGSVLHKSERNTSPQTRFAYTFHMIDSPPYAVYDEKNWLQPTPEMPFSRILPNAIV